MLLAETLTYQEAHVTPNELRNARKALNMSSTELADALQLSDNGARLVRRWEQGDVAISGPAAAAVGLLLELRRLRCEYSGAAISPERL